MVKTLQAEADLMRQHQQAVVEYERCRTEALDKLVDAEKRFYALGIAAPPRPDDISGGDSSCPYPGGDAGQSPLSA